MEGFPVQIPLSVFWTWSSPTVVYKINKSASLHPSQIVYKNNSIPRRFSNTRKNFGGSNLKQGYYDLPVTESRICYKLKEISSSPNTENRILGDDHRLCGDDSVPVSGEGRVDFQKVSGYIVNVGGVNKRPSKAFGNIIINSIGTSYCNTVHEVQIYNLCLKRDYNRKVALGPLCKEELNWWISVISHQVEPLIQSDASKTGWEVFC